MSLYTLFTIGDNWVKLLSVMSHEGTPKAIISTPKGKLRPFFSLKIASILSRATSGFNDVWVISLCKQYTNGDIWVLPLTALSYVETPKGIQSTSKGKIGLNFCLKTS
jgi:hypothetical protein